MALGARRLGAMFFMSMHCLIIEDERDTAHFIRKGLKEAGYIVTCCNELVEGLNALILMIYCKNFGANN